VRTWAPLLTGNGTFFDILARDVLRILAAMLNFRIGRSVRAGKIRLSALANSMDFCTTPRLAAARKVKGGLPKNMLGVLAPKPHIC
jgi:hypothetical protein